MRSTGNSKQYLGKEYTEQQINELDCNNFNTLLNRYESVLSAQMTKALGKSVIKEVASKFLWPMEPPRLDQSVSNLAQR